MDKKGFTLTELIATLVIIGVLLMIAIPSVSNLHNKFKQNYYKELEKSVLESAKTYFRDNAESRPVNILEASIVSYDDLTNNKYIDKITEYNSDTTLNGYVVIVKLKDDYIYKNCYTRNGVNQYKDVEYGTNKEDNICHFNDADKITKVSNQVIRENKDGILYKVDI